MDRLSPSSSSSSAYRTDTPSLSSIPEKDIVRIISLLDKADNQTLSSLVQSRTDRWRIAGADALRSFFYAAVEAMRNADTDRKVTLLTVLTDWLHAVSSQLPDETRWQIIQHMIDLSRIEVSTLSQMDEVLKSLIRLLKATSQELTNLNTQATESPISEANLSRCVHVNNLNQQLLKHCSYLFEQYSAQIRSLQSELAEAWKKND